MIMKLTRTHTELLWWVWKSTFWPLEYCRIDGSVTNIVFLVNSTYWYRMLKWMCISTCVSAGYSCMMCMNEYVCAFFSFMHFLLLLLNKKWWTSKSPVGLWLSENTVLLFNKSKTLFLTLQHLDQSYSSSYGRWREGFRLAASLRLPYPIAGWSSHPRMHSPNLPLFWPSSRDCEPNIEAFCATNMVQTEAHTRTHFNRLSVRQQRCAVLLLKYHEHRAQIKLHVDLSYTGTIFIFDSLSRKWCTWSESTTADWFLNTIYNGKLALSLSLSLDR